LRRNLSQLVACGAAPERGMAQSGSASALGVEGLRLKAFIKNKKIFTSRSI
jgi:hypothetical protein